MSAAQGGKKKIIIISVIAAAVVIIAAVVLIILLGGSGEGYSSISVKEIVGDVTVEHKGDTYKAYPNMRLTDGFAMTTAAASYSRMNLDDAKFVKLEEQSRARFEALGTGSKSTSILLEYGEISSEIARPLGASEGYTITTPNAVLSVRGTLFVTRVRKGNDGKWLTDVYTFGGSVSSHRILPDGTNVDEDVRINAGYKATIKMDDETTYYIEEVDEDIGDNVDPIDINDIDTDILVDVYAAAQSGHDVGFTQEELLKVFEERGVDLSQYTSYRTGEPLAQSGNSSGAPAGGDDGDVTTSGDENGGEDDETGKPEDTDAPGTSDDSGESAGPAVPPDGQGGNVIPGGNGGEGGNGGNPPAPGSDDTTQPEGPDAGGSGGDPTTPDPQDPDTPTVTTPSDDGGNDDHPDTMGDISGEPEDDEGGDGDDDTTEPPENSGGEPGDENPGDEEPPDGDTTTPEPSETTSPDETEAPEDETTTTTSSGHYIIPGTTSGETTSGDPEIPAGDLICPYCGYRTTEWKVEISDADCIHDGIKFLICPKCGKAVDKMTIPATGKHSYGVGETIQAKWSRPATVGSGMAVNSHFMQYTLNREDDGGSSDKPLRLTVTQSCLICSATATVVRNVTCYPDATNTYAYTFTGLDGGTHTVTTTVELWWPEETCEHIFGLKEIKLVSGSGYDAIFNGTLVCSNCSTTVTVTGTVTNVVTMSDNSTKYFIDFTYNGQTWSDTYTTGCTHDYNYGEEDEPGFMWNSDYSSCTARFYCLKGCGNYKDVTCEVGIEELDTENMYTASCEFNDITYSDFVTVCRHNFDYTSDDTPSFSWSSDHSTCTAKFVCLYGCGAYKEETCEVSITELSDSTDYEASCEFNGVTFSDIYSDPKSTTTGSITIKDAHMTNNFVGSSTHGNGSPSVSLSWSASGLGTDTNKAVVYVAPMTLTDLGSSKVDAVPHWALTVTDGTNGSLSSAGAEVNGTLVWAGLNNSMPRLGHYGQSNAASISEDYLNTGENCVMQVAVYNSSGELAAISSPKEVTVDWSIGDPYMTTDTIISFDFGWADGYEIPSAYCGSSNYVVDVEVYAWSGWNLPADPYSAKNCWIMTLSYDEERAEANTFNARGGNCDTSLYWSYSDDAYATPPTLTVGSKVSMGVEVIVTDLSTYKTTVLKRSPVVKFTVGA